MTGRSDAPRLPSLDTGMLADAIAGLPARTPVQRRPRTAPPSLRPAALDPLQVDVFAAIIATLPSRQPTLRLLNGGRANG